MGEKLSWKVMAPWFTLFFSIIAVVLLSSFLITNVEWLKVQYFNKGDSIFNLNIYLIHSALLKRIIAFYTSLLLIFIGFGVSAYVLTKQAELKFEIKSIGISIMSFSPGIIAMVLGVLLMITSITSKDEFVYKSNDYEATSASTMDWLFEKDNTK